MGSPSLNIAALESLVVQLECAFKNVESTLQHVQPLLQAMKAESKMCQDTGASPQKTLPSKGLSHSDGAATADVKTESVPSSDPNDAPAPALFDSETLSTVPSDAPSPDPPASQAPGCAPTESQPPAPAGTLPATSPCSLPHYSEQHSSESAISRLKVTSSQKRDSLKEEESGAQEEKESTPKVTPLQKRDSMKEQESGAQEEKKSTPTLKRFKSVWNFLLPKKEDSVAQEEEESTPNLTQGKSVWDLLQKGSSMGVVLTKLPMPPKKSWNNMRSLKALTWYNLILNHDLEVCTFGCVSVCSRAWVRTCAFVSAYVRACVRACLFYQFLSQCPPSKSGRSILWPRQ